MKEYKEPKPGDEKAYCAVCTQSVSVLSADSKGKVRVVDNGKTIPKHYLFGIDMNDLSMHSWVCEGGGRKQQYFVYQPILWTKDGKPSRYGWKPKNWKPKSKAKK
jgi:hypothetical protein